MSMIDRVFLQRSISAALSARQVRSKAQAVKRKAKRQQRSELAASRQLVASIRQEREAAAMRARARKNLPDSLTGRRPQKNRFSRSAPSLQQSPPTGVPRLKLANALKSRRRRESEPNGPVVMPADAQGMQRPDNMWKVVNDNVARQARADEARDKRRKKKLAVRGCGATVGPQWVRPQLSHLTTTSCAGVLFVCTRGRRSGNGTCRYKWRSNGVRGRNASSMTHGMGGVVACHTLRGGWFRHRHCLAGTLDLRLNKFVTGRERTRLSVRRWRKSMLRFVILSGRVCCVAPGCRAGAGASCSEL